MKLLLYIFIFKKMYLFSRTGEPPAHMVGLPPIFGEVKMNFVVVVRIPRHVLDADRQIEQCLKVVVMYADVGIGVVRDRLLVTPCAQQGSVVEKISEK